MFRFFSQLARKKIAQNAVSSGSAQEQIQQMLKNPTYSEIIANMQKQTSHLKPSSKVKNDFSVEKIEELLCREEENTKFSIY